MADSWIQKLRNKFVAVWRLAENSVDQPVHRTFYDPDPEPESDAADDTSVHDCDSSFGMNGLLRNATEDSSWEAASAGEPLQKRGTVELLVAISKLCWISGLASIGIATLAIATLPLARGLSGLGNLEVFVGCCGVTFLSNFVGLTVALMGIVTDHQNVEVRKWAIRHFAVFSVIVFLWLLIVCLAAF